MNYYIKKIGLLLLSLMILPVIGMDQKTPTYACDNDAFSKYIQSPTTGNEAHLLSYLNNLIQRLHDNFDKEQKSTVQDIINNPKEMAYIKNKLREMIRAVFVKYDYHLFYGCFNNTRLEHSKFIDQCWLYVIQDLIEQVMLGVRNPLIIHQLTRLHPSPEHILDNKFFKSWSVVNTRIDSYNKNREGLASNDPNVNKDSLKLGTYMWNTSPLKDIFQRHVYNELVLILTLSKTESKKRTDAINHLVHLLDSNLVLSDVAIHTYVDALESLQHRDPHTKQFLSFEEILYRLYYIPKLRPALDQAATMCPTQIGQYLTPIKSKVCAEEAEQKRKAIVQANKEKERQEQEVRELHLKKSLQEQAEREVLAKLQQETEDFKKILANAETMLGTIQTKLQGVGAKLTKQENDNLKKELADIVTVVGNTQARWRQVEDRWPKQENENFKKTVKHVTTLLGNVQASVQQVVKATLPNLKDVGVTITTKGDGETHTKSKASSTSFISLPSGKQFLALTVIGCAVAIGTWYYKKYIRKTKKDLTITPSGKEVVVNPQLHEQHNMSVTV